MDCLDQPSVYKGLRRPGCVHAVHPSTENCPQAPGRRPRSEVQSAKAEGPRTEHDEPNSPYPLLRFDEGLLSASNRTFALI